MQAQDTRGILRLFRDRIDVQARGVGGEDGLVRADLVELLEHLVLDFHLLEDRLDHQVGLSQVAVVGGPANTADPSRAFVVGKPAFGERFLVGRADFREAAVQRLLRLVDHHRGNPGIREGHGDAAAHGAEADHAHPANGPHGRALLELAGLLRLALGEEHVPQGPRLLAAQELEEGFAFQPQGLVERKGHRPLHAIERRRWRLAPAGGLLEVGLDAGEAFGSQRNQGDVARAPGRTSTDPFRQGDGAFARGVARNRFIHEAEWDRLVRPHATSIQNQVERLLEADEARQASGAAGAGQNPQGHFGKTQFRARFSHPVVAAERQLQCAPRSGSVECSHDRFGRPLDTVDEIRERRAFRRGSLELADVGARAEVLPRSCDHHRAHRDVGEDRVELLEERLLHRGAKRVHRRVVEREHSHAASHFENHSHRGGRLSLDGGV